MKKILQLSVWIFFLPMILLAKETDSPAEGTYKLVIEGFDWGPAVNKIILSLDQPVEEVKASDFEVFVTRTSKEGEIPAAQTSGKRTVVYAYPSDENGNRVSEGNHATLVLAVSPVNPLGSPIQYMRVNNRGSNIWIDYGVTVVDSKSGKTWNQELGRIRPIVDDFELKGQFTHGNVTLPFAYFTPEKATSKAPLIIWLHGGGEGGNDPTIALMGNKAFNYASPEIQTLFGQGAYVLVPQSPTFWMQAGDGMTRGQTNDIYNEALFALFQDFVAKNPNVDPTRIYVGGCSNGGYMSLKLILEHPDYFAAGYISALAYSNNYISDAQIQKIKNVPIWFVHSKDDNTTKPDETVVPLFDRLKKAGAKNVHFSYYDHVTDITGFYGGQDFRYNGHWSWIYSHANVARTDLDGSPVMLDGRPVTIMEWMAAQKKKK
ncbi:prolyl oligopeptidase family serine peptidase [Algoriphagus sp. CAU 1675]|uniref:prolyl oligopeptidase family serine peptidase n=1 Tax=Algoriphagus sp. CAU 1675 TaxID=3032597 RepID=UPI0023D9C183|nr:prolyl oligopeptidase family serine peptidase [Algoriphagus sp. CAU 1675]MDF2158341.1 prolyl oligopeptidase family serine peptidase [Algoriphagus sp. CAU 1675]